MSVQSSGLSNAVAQHIASVRYEDLPPDVVEVTKRSILDGIGVMLGASGVAPECRPFATLALRNGGGLREATVLGFGARTAAAEAAFANGAMSHALDFEDAHVVAPVHANAAAIPALLALAETHRASGAAMITGIAVGCDIASRLALAVGSAAAERGWYAPPIFAAQGAVAGAAVLLGLAEQQVRDAMSIAACQVAPSFEIVNGERSVLRSVREAVGARAALVAVELAAAGVAGGPEPLDGRFGVLPMFAGQDWHTDPVLNGLGTSWEGPRTSFKLWPSCRGTHPFIEGVLRLRREVGLSPDNLRSITATGGPIARMLIEPIARKRSPRTAIDAKFSLPYTIATAVVRGEVGLDSFGEGCLEDPAVLAMARRVECTSDERRSDTTAHMVIRTTADQEYVVEVDEVPGDPGRSLEQSALEAKFIDCATRAAVPLPDGVPARLIELIGALQDVDDVRRELGDLLGASAG